MITGSKIRAGRCSEMTKYDKGVWLFVDVGFSMADKTCGILKPNGTADVVTFDCLKQLVIKEAQETCPPLNLVLEAPLSVAFNGNGNPTRRNCDTLKDKYGNDKKDKNGHPKHRDWYVNAGAAMLVATTHLLRAVLDSGIQREIRLFEGFLSFKSGRTKSDHIKDVKKLRKVAWYGTEGKIFAPEKLRKSCSDRLESAFKVAGMDFGIPPVIFVYPSPCP